MPTSYLQKAKRAPTTALLQTLPLYNEPIEINDSRYKSSTVFPWSPPEKRLELFHRTSRFLIVYPDGGDLTGLIAFTMFRFEREDNAEGRPQNVLYCYEVQVNPIFQSHGLGAILVNHLVDLAKAWHMKKVMLTVLLTNSRAIRFYQRQGYESLAYENLVYQLTVDIRFITDEISPDDEEYLILSKSR